MRSFWRPSVALVVWLGALGVACADDWTAIRLQGAVFELVNSEWSPLSRGAVVSDDRVIRSAVNGRAVFLRGEETIELGPNTAIQIHDRGGQSYTLVQQYFGEVTVEAEARDVQHFEVHTRVLAAVVKGTQFTVRTETNTAEVQVLRGTVEVSDSQHANPVPVAAGQTASATAAVPAFVGSASPVASVEIAVSGVAEVSAGGTGGPPANSNAGGNGNASANSNAGGNGNASANSNAGGNGNASSNPNAGGNGNPSANSNAGGNSNPSANSNAGGNGNGNANSNAGGNGNGNGNS